MTLAENGQIAVDLVLAAQRAGKPFDVISHGHADARHGRLRGHPAATTRGLHEADHCFDRSRHDGRPAEVHGRKVAMIT